MEEYVNECRDALRLACDPASAAVAEFRLMEARMLAAALAGLPWHVRLAMHAEALLVRCLWSLAAVL